MCIEEKRSKQLNQEDEDDLAKEPPRKVISQETTVSITQSGVNQ